ncbi:MAG: GuaB1 family IMP dehydrogenase-related protein [Gulosibacter sp.]|uniref:GMP reductase n=1 Tax=Gulosibacter sp. TaxID=2817531 RepID=UPI003F91DB67
MQFYGQEPQHDLTYSDVFLIPSRSEVGSRLNVDLATNDATGMQLPLVASNMNSVTGPRMASAMARRGGIAVLPQDLSDEQLTDGIRWVKAQHPVWSVPFEFESSATIAEVLQIVPAISGQSIAVREGGEVKLIFEASGLDGLPEDASLGDLGHLSAPMVGAEELADPRSAFDLLEEVPGKLVAVEDHGQLVGALSQRDALRSTIYRPNIGEDGRLRVAAALGINGDIVGRAEKLRDAGADALVIDTAHGHQESMLRAITKVREADLGLPIAAGNVVSGAGTRDLVSAGANIVKVGVGPGAMCTTRMMTAVGRPQFSAVLECAETAQHHGAVVWADGGVRYPRDVALALAAGGTAVMIGSWFAGTCEAPGTVKMDAEGRLYKESFGMASTRAVTDRFGKLDAYERARKMLFAEGISNSTILMDPNLPSVDDLIDIITTGVRSSFTYAGAATLAEFSERAKVGVQSAAGYEEGKPLPVSW